MTDRRFQPTSSSTAAAASPLERLLAQTRALVSAAAGADTGSSTTSSSGGASLTQLVPVHDALISSLLLSNDRGGGIGSAAAALDADGDTDEGDGEDAVRTLLPDDEADACLRALTRGSGPEALAAAQYLLAIVRRRRRAASTDAAGSSLAVPADDELALSLHSYLADAEDELLVPTTSTLGASDGAESALLGLERAALPLLFAPPDEDCVDANDDDGDDDGDDDVPHPLLNPEVRDAIVIAAFSTAAARDVPLSADAADAAGRCAALCVDAARSSLYRSPSDDGYNCDAVVVPPRTVLDSACTVLVRLLDLCGDSSSEAAQEAVRRMMHELTLLVIDAVCYSSDGGGGAASGNVDLIRPLTGLLLPRLYDAPVTEEAKEADDLWDALRGLMTGDDNDAAGTKEKTGQKRKCGNWNDVAPTVAAAVLCIVAPPLASYPLPSSASGGGGGSIGNGNVERVVLLRHPVLWSFLRTSLGRGAGGLSLGASDGGRGGGGGGTGARGGGTARGGASFVKNTGGRAGGTAAAATDEQSLRLAAAAADQMLRRRSVHVLGKLVEAAEADAAVRSSEATTATAAAKSAPPQSKKKKKKGQKKGGRGGPAAPPLPPDVAVWKKYVLCFEALEMEEETHLIEQIWPTVRELCLAAAAADLAKLDGNAAEGGERSTKLPPIAWEWIGALLARALLSETPTLRKLALFRFLNGDAGVSAASSSGGDDDGESTTKKKGLGGGVASPPPSTAPAAPLSLVSPSFVLNVVLPSFDSLGPSVGTSVHMIDPRTGKLVVGDNEPKFRRFVAEYVRAVLSGDDAPDRMEELMAGFLSAGCIRGLKPRTLDRVFASVTRALTRCDGDGDGDSSAPPPLRLPISNKVLDGASSSLGELFDTHSVIAKLRRSLTDRLAVMLSRSYVPDDDDDEKATNGKRRETNTKTKTDPLLVLRVLSLYPTPLADGDGDREDRSRGGMRSDDDGGEDAAVDEAHPDRVGGGGGTTREALHHWLSSVGTPDGRPPNAWASDAGSACASAFVAGHLPPPADGGISAKLERSVGASIVRLCALAGDNGGGDGPSASGMLWPSVGRGLSAVPPLPDASAGVQSALSASLGMATDGKVTRSLLLLEYGAREGILAGVGHGELVVDSKTGAMLPPSPQIERLLSGAVHSILARIQTVSLCVPGTADDTQTVGVGTAAHARSRVAGGLSSGLASSVEQLRTLRRAFPSSVALGGASDALLNSCLGKLRGDADEAAVAGDDGVDGEARREMDTVKYMALTFAVLALGTELGGAGEADSGLVVNLTDLVEICGVLLDSAFVVPANCGNYPRRQLTAARSVFQYAKWGSLSCLLSMLSASEGGDAKGNNAVADAAFYDRVFDAAAAAVHATPPDALLTLFDAATSAARAALSSRVAGTGDDDSLAAQPHKMARMIKTLFAVIDDTSHSPSRVAMMDATCALLFRPRLVLEEYRRAASAEGRGQKGGDSVMPIRNAFRKLMKAAGTNKPHIAKGCVSRMAVAWLGCDDDDGHRLDGESSEETEGREQRNTAGLGAIPYRDDIIGLLVYKEDRLTDDSAHQDTLVRRGDGKEDAGVEALRLPAGTNDLTIVRGFVLLFISKIPDPNAGLDPRVLTELVHPIISALLDICCSQPKRGGNFLLTGSAEYCRKTRAWQALCLLSRFVTPDVTSATLERTFEAMSMILHGQIRYFIEVFCIQIARAHPALFGRAYVTQIRMRDLNLQHVSSLMIIGGNLIVGRYREDFLREGGEQVPLHEVLAGTLPWLSSTQGFSRAIAQLLAHELIPLVVDVKGAGKMLEPITANNDWFLRSMYEFLEENPEMARLRKKQRNFFFTYDAESVCTADGLLLIPVDEGDEADPVHLADAMKVCLKNVFLEANASDCPTWKKADELLDKLAEDGGDAAAVDVSGGTGSHDPSSSLVNFQRKILPVDALNLALERSRAESLRNAAGRTRQGLIVCASLIEKVPNLAGLARTAEIFAADRLIVPDKSVRKMDNFKSISVSAGDWINIDECRERDLLPWLKKRKQEGYTIVGVEQTSSSICLSSHNFNNKTVLLLGKEKEGIPVEFLSVVDVCVEIPQLGIIRSLNVHVSGALTIWEYSKQMMSGNK